LPFDFYCFVFVFIGDGKPTNAAYSSEDLLKVTQEQLSASASTATATADATPPTTNSQEPEGYKIFLSASF
jgi:hypothetical protein